MSEQARYTVKAPNGQTYSFSARAGLNRRQAESALERAMPAAFQQRYTVRADDGQTYSFNARDGMSQSEARRALHRAVPETDRDRNAIGAGFAAARTALTTGLPYALDRQFGTVTPEEEARYRAAMQESARIQEERLPGGAPSFGDMTSGRSDFFGGLMENLGQSIPQAVPAVIGGIGGAAIGTAVAPGPGTLAGGIGGVLGGVGASTPFFVGSNVARATEGGRTALTRDAAGRALAVAPLQAGADVLAAKFIPGVGRLFGGPATSTAVSRLARPGLARGAIRVGQGAVAGGAAEAGQQFGERYAAGLPLGDREAMGEYGESAALGAIMDASIGAAGAPFSGRRDGVAPSPTVASAPPAATDFGTEEDTAAIAKEVRALAPEQKAVFDTEYTRIIDEGLTSEATAAIMALDAAKRVPVTVTQGTEDVVSVGRPDGESVPSLDARGELDGTPTGPEGVAAGDVGEAGSPTPVGLQSEGNVDVALTTATPKRRKGKAAVAPIAEGENLAATAAAEMAAPVDQTPTAPTVEAPAATSDPTVVMRTIEQAAATELPEGPARDAFLTGASARLFGGDKGVRDAVRRVSPELRPVVQQGAEFVNQVAPVTPAVPVVSEAASTTETAPATIGKAPLPAERRAAQAAKTADLNAANVAAVDALEAAGGDPKKVADFRSLIVNPSPTVSPVVLSKLIAREASKLPAADAAQQADNMRTTIRPPERSRYPDGFVPDPEFERRIQGKTLSEAVTEAAVSRYDRTGDMAYFKIGTRVSDKIKAMEQQGFSFDVGLASVGDPRMQSLSSSGQMKMDMETGAMSVLLRDSKAIMSGATPEILMHEAVHAVSSPLIREAAENVLSPNRAVYEELRALFKEVSAQVDTLPADLRTSNAMKNEREFMTWGLTNKPFQDWLRTVPVKGGNAWSAFVEVMRKLLGIDKAETNALSRLLEVSDKVFAADTTPASPVQWNALQARKASGEQKVLENKYYRDKNRPTPKQARELLNEATTRNEVASVLGKLEDTGVLTRGDLRAIREALYANVGAEAQQVQNALSAANELITRREAEKNTDYARAKKTPAAPLTPADRAAARSLEETKDVVTEATKKFAASDPVANPKKAADPNYAAGNVSTAMPFLEKAWRTMNTPAFKKWLEVMPLSRMAEWGEKNVPGLTTLYHMGTKKIGQLHTYQRRFNEITKQLVAVANKYGQEAISKVAYYTRINRVDVTELGDTLAASYNADKPLQWYATELAKKSVSAARKKRLEKAALLREAEVREVHELWQQLGDQKGGREAFLATQKFYKTMYDALRALNYSAMRRLNVSEQTQKELKETFDNAIEGESEETTGMPRNLYPREYVPAKRFGEFWLNIEADTSKDNKRQRVFATFDTAGERDAELQRLSGMYGLDKDGKDADGTRVVKTGNSMKELQDAPDVRGTMLEKLFNALDTAAKEGADLPNKKQVEALKKELFSTWLMSSSANSLQRNFIETKELVAGFSQDLSRVFGDSAMQYASLLASAEYDRKIEGQIEKLRGDIAEQHAPDDQSRYRMFVDEMENRLVQDYAAQNGPNMFNSVNRAMFFYFLTAPATAAAQWVQLPGVALPFLGAEYGYGKATAAFVKYLDFAKTLGTNETNALGEKVFSLPSMRNSNKFKNDPLFRRAYLAGAGRAVFETMVDVITSSAATPAKAKTKGALAKNALLKTNEVVTGTLSAVYTTAELVTREVAYMAAFDLHYAKTGNFEASVNAAVTATNKSMGSYLDIERPTFMKYSAVRSLTAFKQYAIAMTSLYMDLVAKIATSKGERLTAAKQLAGITAMGALLGGVPGTMVFGIIGSTFGVAMKAALDDEEKEAIRAEDPLVNPLDNFEAWFRRKWLPETYGTGMGDIVENGIISELTGADFASRLSNSNMWWRDGKPGETPSQDILNAAAANIPPLSMAMSVADATKDFSEGRLLRGTAKIVPAFLRGGVNAVLLNKQGVESPTTGDTSIEPEELNMADIIAQTVGFVPMKVSDFRKESFAFQGARTEAGRAKTRVMGNLYRVLMDETAEPGQLERAIAAIERHNMRYPPGTPYFIDERTLMTSLERQESSDERTYRGMMLRDEEARLAPTYEGDR